ncbi:hypothetical protein CPSG_03229 [Coccidioides posadasii str. Silveira]|uniref:Uncharacterized protein n=1 Tax=Coccidioides posadasii (strain RMSCC 757 / Silveira) TaxID=443226 RepID=E9D150_COCPS|nr:hypothetical protein CPSG_03229 [Coccidioides posadasii str. Silveira]
MGARVSPAQFLLLRVSSGSSSSVAFLLYNCLSASLHSAANSQRSFSSAPLLGLLIFS